MPHRVITDEDLDQATREIDISKKITKILRSVPEDRRMRVLRAASILLTGKDLTELEG
jgi:hypothetical protein